MKARANERNASLLVIVQRVQPSFKPKGLNERETALKISEKGTLAVPFSDIFAFSFDVIFTLYCLAVEDHIGKGAYPVTKEYATCRAVNYKVLVDVTVTEDEAVDIGVSLDVLACKERTVLVVNALERSIALDLMLLHAVTRPGVSHPQAPSGVYHREHPLQETVVEYRTQDAEALLGRELVTMGKEELLIMEFNKTGFAVDNHTAFLLEVVKTPHVVVAGEEVYLHSPVGQLGHLAKETCKALGHGIPVLVPEIEHIAKHIHRCGLVLYLVEERHKTALVRTWVFNGP